MCCKLRVDISKTLAKYCTKEYERLIGAKLKRNSKLSLSAEYLVTKGESAVITEHPLLPSTQLELRESVSSGQVLVHSESRGSEG